MEYVAASEEEGAPAKIKGFTPKLTAKKLIRIENNWYASDETHRTRLPEEVDPKEVFKKAPIKL